MGADRDDIQVKHRGRKTRRTLSAGKREKLGPAAVQHRLEVAAQRSKISHQANAKTDPCQDYYLIDRLTVFNQFLSIKQEV